jgi:hypothetical protein
MTDSILKTCKTSSLCNQGIRRMMTRITSISLVTRMRATAVAAPAGAEAAATRWKTLTEKNLDHTKESSSALNRRLQTSLEENQEGSHGERHQDKVKGKTA